MKIHAKKIWLAGALLVSNSYIQAGTIDFIDLAENVYGESAWTSLNLNVSGINMTIKGLASNDNDLQQYAYLDWGTAGLGVCKDAISTGANPGSSSNRCNPSSDDNVTFYESLVFSFDKNAIINNLWFNNNHDGGFDQGDQVNIAGNPYNVTTGYVGDGNGIGSFFVAANTDFIVKFQNEQFYISGMEVTAPPPPPPPPVPEPTSLALLGLGYLGLGFMRRRWK